MGHFVRLFGLVWGARCAGVHLGREKRGGFGRRADERRVPPCTVWAAISGPCCTAEYPRDCVQCRLCAGRIVARKLWARTQSAVCTVHCALCAPKTLARLASKTMRSCGQVIGRTEVAAACPSGHHCGPLWPLCPADTLRLVRWHSSCGLAAPMGKTPPTGRHTKIVSDAPLCRPAAEGSSLAAPKLAPKTVQSGGAPKGACK